MPALPATNFITKDATGNRQIKPTQRYQDYQTKNIVTKLARNNSRSYVPTITQTTQYEFSFFPRTIADWNNLEEETVKRTSVDSFRTALLEGSTNPN